MISKNILALLATSFISTNVLLAQRAMTHTDSINALLPQTDISIDADSTIDLPEGLFEVEETAYTWMERQFLHVDDGCISDSIGRFVPDSVYQMRLAALPTVIEMSWNHEVARCLDLYLNKRRKLIERMVGLGYNYYFPIFEEALQRHELPSELKYLACIESGLRQNAYSPARAAGLWQFIPGTGVLQGLEINSYIDERYDVYKSTDAACRYLKGLYNKFGDWHLAIAAYNCGPGNVSKAMVRSRGGKTFWEIYKWLPRETRAYVPLYIAAVYVMTYHCEHNLCATLNDIPPTCDTIMLNRPVNFEQIATLIPNLTIEQVENLNPQYTHDIIPASQERQYALALPSDKAMTFIQNQDTIMGWRADELLPQNGMWREVSSKGRTNSYVRDGGNRLSERSQAGSKGGRGQKGSSASGSTYKVKKGDTLASIARRHGCTVAQLKKANGMKKNIVRVGQKIFIP